MHTKEDFRKMVVDLDERMDNLVLVLFAKKGGIYVYKVSEFQEVDETIYNTDELYNCQIDKIIYSSGKKPCVVDGCYDFNIDDIYEIKDARTEEILYRKS
jgi:hypothetical protein